MLSINTNYSIVPYNCKPIKNNNKISEPITMKYDSVSFSGYREKKNIEDIAKNNPLLKIYLKDISRYPILDKKQTNELFSKMANGGKDAEEARKKLIEANLRLVPFTIMKCCPNMPMPIMDCIQSGNIGLMKAVDKFNHKQKCTFASYAVDIIKFEIFNAIADQTRVIRIPRDKQAKIRILKKAEDRYTQVRNKIPTNKELARYIGCSVPEVVSLKKIDNCNNMGNVESVVFDKRKTYYSPQKKADFDVTSEDIYLYRDSIQDSQDFYEQIRQSDIKRDINTAINTLSENPKLVIQKRLLAQDDESDTLRELVNLMGKSRARIWQLEKEGMRKLRMPQIAKFLGENIY